MHPPSFWHKAFACTLAVATCFAFAAGCSKQSEGERCDFQNAGNTDCSDGLVCVQKSGLQVNDVSRCCPPVGEPISDSRCTRSGGTVSASGGSGGTSSTSGGSGGTSGSAGANEGGAAGTPEVTAGSAGQTATAGAAGN